MTTPHSDVASELWSLAETVLTRLEPLLRQAVQNQENSPRQGCSWCPVCALAALVRGEQHDLVTLLASEGSTVIALIRQLIAEHAPPAEAAGPGGRADTAGQDRPPGRAPAATSDRAATCDRAATSDHAATSDRAASASATAGAPADRAFGAGMSDAENRGEDPMIRRAAFQPITVTVKDSTTPDRHD